MKKMIKRGQHNAVRCNWSAKFSWPLFILLLLIYLPVIMISNLKQTTNFTKQQLVLLSRPVRCELSRLRCHGHSLLLSSYLHRMSRKENSARSAGGHPLQNLNPLLPDCSASEPLRKSIFGSSLYSPTKLKTNDAENSQKLTSSELQLKIFLFL